MALLKDRAVKDWPPAVQPLLKAAGTTEPRELPHHTYITQGDEDGCQLYLIVKDTDEGRAYEQLATDVERLAYMQAHAHESWGVAHPSHAFVYDGNKVYKIGRREAPAAWHGPGSGGEWKHGSAEWKEYVQFFKDHATCVEDPDPDENFSDCSDFEVAR
ncbi:hypothetical protein PG984_015563 [Apiospora sp. TS-2023a]